MSDRRIEGLNKKRADGDNARNTRGDLDRGSRLSPLRGGWDEYVLNGFTMYLEVSAKRDYVTIERSRSCILSWN